MLFPSSLPCGIVGTFLRMSSYKRGTTVINGKRYGFYPDGSRYRLYEHRVPFLSLAEKEDEVVLRVRQATEKGYAEVPVGGCADLAYPDSAIRRSRTVGGGQLVNALTCSHQLCVFVEI